jgi:hypothetical protein
MGNFIMESQEQGAQYFPCRGRKILNRALHTRKSCVNFYSDTLRSRKLRKLFIAHQICLPFNVPLV